MGRLRSAIGHTLKISQRRIHIAVVGDTRKWSHVDLYAGEVAITIRIRYSLGQVLHIDHRTCGGHSEPNSIIWLSIDPEMSVGVQDAGVKVDRPVAAQCATLSKRATCLVVDSVGQVLSRQACAA